MSRSGAMIIFPALALVFSASCADAGSIPERSSRTSAAIRVSTTVAPKSAAVSTTDMRPVAQGSTAALTVLGTIRIARETPAGYQRTKFRHWVDADGDGCNTREEVLIAESSSSPQVMYPGCKVVEGDWVSAYDGAVVNDPAEIDIDHFVPLKEAWDSGAAQWNAAKRQTYANDLSDARALIAVTASANRSKSDKDPPQWMPPNSSVFCTYLSDWVAVKARWKLTMDESEYRFIDKRLRGQCAGTTLEAWGIADRSVPTPAATTIPGATDETTPPTTRVDETVPNSTVKGNLPAVHPGSFCSPRGAFGTSSGRTYVCSTTNAAGQPYAGGRARWRPA